MLIARDVTAQRRAEEERERLETELARAEKLTALGTLSRGIAHDFNNILTGIIAYANLARMDALLRVMSTQAAADLDALHEAIDRGDGATVVVLSRRLQAIADQLESPQAAAPLAALASETQGTAWHALLEDARTALRTAMARACNFALSAT